MAVVGMCLVEDTGGYVRLAEAPASDRRYFAAQLHKWLMTMGFVVKLWSFHFYSIGCPQPAGVVPEDSCA
jgi:hypothetical protein